MSISQITNLVVENTLMSMESQDHKPIPLIDHTEKEMKEDTLLWETMYQKL